MPYVVVAKWIARHGEEENVAAAIRALTSPSRAEPGCLRYDAFQDVEEPRTFLLVEVYVDEAAYQAHGASAHFQTHATADGIPRLERREREFYEPLES